MDKLLILTVPELAKAVGVPLLMIASTVVSVWWIGRGIVKRFIDTETKALAAQATVAEVAELKKKLSSSEESRKELQLQLDAVVIEQRDVANLLRSLVTNDTLHKALGESANRIWESHRKLERRVDRRFAVLDDRSKREPERLEDDEP